MFSALQSRLHRLLNGLWFVPAVMTTGFALAAIGLTELDHSVRTGHTILFGGDAAAARTVVSTIAGSLITVAGLVLSLTVVVLQLASSQFSPRILPTVLGDRVTQAIVGIFVGVFVFCLLTLRSIGGPGEFVPRLTVTATSVLAVVAVGALIVFIHHISQLIQVSHTLRRVGHATEARLETLYPSPFGEPAAAAENVVAAWRRESDSAALAGSSSGYVAEILLEEVARALPAGTRVHLRAIPGDFVTARTHLADVYPAQSLDEELRLALLGSVVVGSERDLVQDAQFGVRQLVDVALRAISPSLNDPTTATTALGYVRSILESIASRDAPQQVRVGAGDVVVCAEQRRFRDYLEPLVEVGRYAQGDVRVVAAVLDACRGAIEAALAAGATGRAAEACDVARRVAGYGLAAARTDPDREEISRMLDELVRIS